MAPNGEVTLALRRCARSRAQTDLHEVALALRQRVLEDALGRPDRAKGYRFRP